MAAHLHSIPVPPVQIDPKLPSMLNEIIMMSIARDPAQRFQSADAFRNALQALKLGPAIAQPLQPAPAVAIPLVAPQITASHPSSRRGTLHGPGIAGDDCGCGVGRCRGSEMVRALAEPLVRLQVPVTTFCAAADHSPLRWFLRHLFVETPSASAPAPSRASAPGGSDASGLFDPAVKKSASGEDGDSSTKRRSSRRSGTGARPLSGGRILRRRLPILARTTMPRATATALRDEGESLMLLETRANSIKGSLQTFAAAASCVRIELARGTSLPRSSAWKRTSMKRRHR